MVLFISKHFTKRNLNLFVSEGMKHPHKVARSLEDEGCMASVGLYRTLLLHGLWVLTGPGLVL